MSGKSVLRETDTSGPAGWMARQESKLRAVMLLGGGIALLGGLCGGLWRLGWLLPHGAGLAALHGPLMISGLFGTMISLERAVALGGGWPYLAPALSALGSLLLLAGLPPVLGAAASVLAGAVLVAASLRIMQEQPALFTGALALGAAAWTIGNLVWFAGGAFADAAGWWLAFLVLTIAGERLELSRLLDVKGDSQPLFVVATILLAAGAGLGIAGATGSILFGIGLLTTTTWLLRHDIARRTIRRRGQVRFFAACMLAGYLWLGVSGFVLLARGVPEGTTYDLALHAVTVGFVLSMVFGHALIILPVVTGLTFPYTPLLYGPLALLHASMLLRFSAGLTNAAELRAASGILTIVAIVAFVACIAAGKLKNSLSATASAGAATPHQKERISP